MHSAEHKHNLTQTLLAHSQLKYIMAIGQSHAEKDMVDKCLWYTHVCMCFCMCVCECVFVCVCVCV